MIFCYSGTGNSLAAAKRFSARFGIPVEMITRELADSHRSVDCDFCIIIFPSYAYGLPVTVRRFLTNASFKAGYMAAITTYGTRYGGTLAEAARLLKKKKQPLHFAAGIKAVENYVHLFGLAKEEKLSNRIELQRVRTEEVAGMLERRIQARVKWRFRPLSLFVSGLFRLVKPAFAHTYRIKESCNGCGICQMVCPAGAVSVEKVKRRNKCRERPVFAARKCDHCQACMQLCPQKAIRYVRITPKSRRYCHPEVTLKELFKRPNARTAENPADKCQKDAD